MSVTLNITSDNVDLLHLELMQILFPSNETRDAVYGFLAGRSMLHVDATDAPAPEPGKVVPMAATAGGPPRRRRGKGNGEPAKLSPVEEVDAAIDGVHEAEETAALSRDEVIAQLTLIWSGADAGTRAKIKAWRDKMGYSLIRDLPEQDVPAALKFINELAASA